MILALWLACATPELPVVPGAPVWLDASRVDADAPAVLHAPAGIAPPVVDGLTFTERAATDDGRVEWEVRGAKGSYVIEVPAGKTLDGQEIPATRLFLDVGVDGPTGGPMEDLLATPAPTPPVWPWVVGGVVGAAALTGLAVWLWQRFRPAPPPPVADPVDVAARKAWAAVRARVDLEPEAMALELSLVYKRYLEAANGWPATARTTREILDNLAGDLTAADLDAARRLLSAMDLVKFAERDTHAGLFESLDADFDRLCRPVRTRLGGAA